MIADKDFAGADFEGWMANRGAHFLRPDRKDEPYRHGSLGREAAAAASDSPEWGRVLWSPAFGIPRAG